MPLQFLRKLERHTIAECVFRLMSPKGRNRKFFDISRKETNVSKRKPHGLMGFFPFDRHPRMRDGQRIALEHLQAELMNSTSITVIHQSPVGTGKTAVGYTLLKAKQAEGAKLLIYATPNKTQLAQLHAMYPDVKVVLGRNEHPCLYPEYTDNPMADEIPCAMLRDCPSRVYLKDIETHRAGETHEPGAKRCPYLSQKYEAMQGGIIACTHAFLVFNVLLSGAFEPEVLVIDEAHRLAQSFRSVLSKDITDWNLVRAMEAIEETSPRQCEKLADFLESLKRMVRRHALDKETLLEESQIRKLYETLMQISPQKLETDTLRAIERGRVHVVQDRDILKQVEDIARSIRRFQHALKFAISGQTEKGYPLSFVIAYGKTEMGPHDKVQYRLTIKDYYVVPLIQKMLPKVTYAFSATIVNSEIFGYETGIWGPYLSIPSNFPVGNTRIYMPTDTAEISRKPTKKRAKTRMLRLVATTAKQFARKGQRSLVIVVSNEERLKFIEIAKEEGLQFLTYGNGIRARECAERFRDGESDCLLGTVAHFGEGLDLPEEIAPVIFYLRPGYPPRDAPQTQFEVRRFKGRVRALWQWRVMVELLQVRGRNVRSMEDLGVTFLVSQHFRRFAFGALPDWLQGAYRGNLSWGEGVKDANKLLSTKAQKEA